MSGDRQVLYQVTAGPYKGYTGYKVHPAEVRGVSHMAYIERLEDGLVYEISPKHVKKLGATNANG